MTFFLVLTVLAIPIGTRIFLHSFISGVHEYETVFLYASDLLTAVFIVVVFALRRRQLQERFHAHGGAALFVLAAAALAATLLGPSMPLGLYVLARLFALILFAYGIGVILTPRKAFQIALAALAISAVGQAVIGIAQFKEQGSVGLTVFGEPVLFSHTGAASTIRVDGGRVLRAYGTFPHPNIYAGFLLLGIFAAAYWYLWCDEQLSRELFKHPRSWWNLRHALKTLNDYLSHRYFFLRLLLAATMFVLITGFALSFSRAGWIAATAGLLAYVIARGFKRSGSGATVRLILLIGVCVITICYMFAPLIMPRANIHSTEPAVVDRVTYANIGLRLAAEQPGGVGAGNQVLYGVRHHVYQQQGFTKVWNWEPVHNIYLLVLVELGWLGLLSFLVFLGIVTWQLLRQPPSAERALAIAALAAILVLGLFDHFLWTLQPGKLMFWLVMGLALSQLPAPSQRASHR